MPSYNYEAIDYKGKTVKGLVSGASSTEAASNLRKNGLIITKIFEENLHIMDKPTAESLNFDNLLIKISIVKAADVVLFLIQLGALINAGVSIISSLSILEKQTSNKKFKHALLEIRKDVELGNPLSEAMSKFPRIFPLMVTNVLKTGETSGLIEVAINRITSYWDEKLTLRNQIITSLSYPAIILIVAIGAITYMLGKVIPEIAAFLDTMGGELPWITQLLITISDKVSSNLINIGVGLGIFIVTLVSAHFIAFTRLKIDKYKIYLPILGGVFHYSDIVFFAKTLAMLIGSGIPVIAALKATRDTMSNRAVKLIIDGMVESISYGDSISDPMFKAGKFFPLMMANMIKVGEETGGLDSCFEMVGDIYSRLLDMKIKRMIGVIEPIMLIFLGGFVAFIAAAMIMAIISAYS
ncbi:type II secretory pathway, component PulF [Clostridium aceticum]|uniref:Type II secretory pathway, component PulF n=1 Tax=Clostridium aceticum TaxID=84022 RepID=A0A0D8IA88_9CLOT|nr:type II secretion system F family protein [Clostridium aceticum]AKL96350.1 type II secretory pathway, component PulF [Clostridium aceticum]KJF26937.1 secretion system protein [Clostridium aceticum]